MPDFNLLQKFGLLGLLGQTLASQIDFWQVTHLARTLLPQFGHALVSWKKKRFFYDIRLRSIRKSGIIRRSNHHQVMYRKPLVNCLSKSVQDFGKPSTASPDQLGSSVGEEPSKAMAAYCRSNYRSSQLAMNKGATYSVWTQCFYNSHLPIFWNFPNWHF